MLAWGQEEGFGEFGLSFFFFFLLNAFSVAEGFFHLQQTLFGCCLGEQRIGVSLSQWCTTHVNISFPVGFLNSRTLEYFMFLSFLLLGFFLP